jgi:hypothetical protein
LGGSPVRKQQDQPAASLDNGPGAEEYVVTLYRLIPMFAKIIDHSGISL